MPVTGAAPAINTLPLAAGELVRVTVVVFGVQELEQVLHGPFYPVFGLDPLEAEGRADGMPRVQRRIRILIYHLNAASQRAHLPGAQVCDVVTVENDSPAGGLEQPGKQAAGGRLAAARLAGQAERLPLGDAEVQAVLAWTAPT